MKTRPDSVASKIGEFGKKVNLSGNYFKLQLAENFEIVLYHVSFAPEIEESKTRRKIVREQSELLGDNFIYDGNKLLYTFRSLQLQEHSITFKANENDENILKIVHKGKIDLSSPEALMVMNIIFRRVMSGLNMQLVGRNLYDPQRSVSEFLLQFFNLSASTCHIKNMSGNCFFFLMFDFFFFGEKRKNEILFLLRIWFPLSRFLVIMKNSHE